LLIAGRWVRSASLQGPWSFARPDSLPAAFQEIPEDSPIGGVRSSIALTVEAQDAVLDLEIPQTTAVKRSEAKLEVTYDGEPNFAAITGTSVAYATNTASQVLRVGGGYYACDNGVWFVAQTARGPWVVADSIPKPQIDSIPPSAPVYNVTYVGVYGSTSEVVYVGYTPGYVGAYPYYGVPVYGTGWYYPPHMGAVYYPRPVTYGFHATYNPWTGWGVGMTWSTGFFTFGVAFGGYGGYHGRGFYPPGGYRGCFNCTINVGGRGNANIGNSVGGGNRARPAARPSQRPANSNLYNRPENRARVADRSTREAATRQLGADRTARGSNNVFADQNGNVHRRTGNGWESRQGNTWTPDRSGGSLGGDRAGGAGARPSNNPSHGMERDWQARQRA
ncbi:MAG: carbohydrate-binding family V/XII, partial [Acidimicrobiales bacterium]